MTESLFWEHGWDFEMQPQRREDAKGDFDLLLAYGEAMFYGSLADQAVGLVRRMIHEVNSRIVKATVR